MRFFTTVGMKAGGAVAAALIVGTALAGAPIASAAPATDAPTTVAECATWNSKRVVTGLGVLENLVFPENADGPVLSEQSMTGTGRLVQIDEQRRAHTLTEVDGPAGLVADGDTVYFNAGTSIAAGLTGPGGSLSAIDLETRKVRTVADGLAFPNGLAQLSDGSFVATRDIGDGPMIRISPDGKIRAFAPSVASSNGIAYDAQRREVVVSTTFAPTTEIVVISEAGKVRKRHVILGFGPLNSADDLTLGADGDVYVTLNVAGKVVRVDRETGDLCTVAAGLPLISAAKFGHGKAGWDAKSLYVTSFDGSIIKLTPRSR